MPRAEVSRRMRSSTSVCTTTTNGKDGASPTSTSNGMSSTTTASSGACATSSVRRCSTRGWTIAFRSARAAASSNTTADRRGRSSAPSGVSTSSPNRRTTSTRPPEPGSTTSCASTSASTITAPQRRSAALTVDLPAPIPPVRPTRSMCSGPPARSAQARSVPGELLPQCLQSLVRGQRAGVLLRLRRRGCRGGLLLLLLAGRGGRGCLGVGRDGVLDLGRVCFPASMCLGVLPLPLLALRLVPLEPLVGLRVESFRVLVVALLVVVRGHPVQGGVEVFSNRGRRVALIGLLERQRDPTTLQVDVDDLDHDVA